MIYRTRWHQRWWLPYGPTCRFGLVGREAALLVVEGSGKKGGGAPVRAAKVTQVLELTDDALSAG